MACVTVSVDVDIDLDEFSDEEIINQARSISSSNFVGIISKEDWLFFIEEFQVLSNKYRDGGDISKACRVENYIAEFRELAEI